jgi:type IV pilus assembly protein PilB
MIPEKLGSVLINKGVITPGDLSLALAVQGSLQERERLGGILCHYDLLSEQKLVEALAEQSGWPVFGGELKLDVEIVPILGKAFLREHGVFPVGSFEGTLFVLSDPYDTAATDHILSLLGPKARFAVGRASVIAAALADALEKEALVRCDAAPMADIAGMLLNEAVETGASDIHIEPSEKAVEVRLRVDGVLRFHRSFPLKDNPRLVNIFFNRAEISAGDFLRFHDARFDHTCGARKVDVRLSHIPSINGSSLVLRLLDKTRSAVSLEKLGYAPVHGKVIERALQKPHGIILLTGPTGCGKTTSLYAMLGQVKSAGVKAVSVEDPVEVRLPLVTQVPVDVKKGHDFHQVARAFLRHDPDIILIGEVRDEKTASEAVRAAITGHRVFSTLHTNDAVSAILRLKDLGVDYSYIANTLVCVVAQRLVRKLCPYCRQEEFVTPASLSEGERIFISGPGEVVFHANAKGCARCFEGFSGRTVVAETLFIDDEIRFMIEQGLVHEIFLKVQERSLSASMRADAGRLVREGVISIAEAMRVVG